MHGAIIEDVLVCANYGDGNGSSSPSSVAVFRRDPTHGGLAPQAASMIDFGEKAAAHAVVIDRGFPHALPRPHVFVVSLGLSKVFQYTLDSEKGSLTPNENGAALVLPSGFRPRHLVIHPTLPRAYLTLEGSGAVNGSSMALLDWWCAATTAMPGR